jgi:rod shape-determining protein MreB
MLPSWISGRFSTDLGIDLGTANTQIYARGRGIVLDEPSVVAINTKTRQVVTVGKSANQMVGRTPEKIHAVRPLQHGVIADFDATEQLLRTFHRLVHRRKRLVRPRVIVGVPCGTTKVERRAIRDSAALAGAREVYLIEKPLAAAMGAGLPVQEPTGTMIVDLGAGRTEVAVIALAGIVYSHSLAVAGDDLDGAIVQFFRRKYNLLIGDQTAERVKIALASAIGFERPQTAAATGRDLQSGLPATVTVTDAEISEAIHDLLFQIAGAVLTALENTPPELSADLTDRGIVLSGGGALLHGFDRLLAAQTHLPVRVVADPRTCVVRGTGKALEELDLLRLVAE